MSVADEVADGPVDWRARLRERFAGSVPSGPEVVRIGGLPVDVSRQYRHLLPAECRPAAVLVPIVDRPEGLTVLLTERAHALRTHAGQIAFPGGRLEPSDRDAVAAALRETEEEIGLDRGFVEVLGYLEDQLVITGFRVTPVVALVRPGFTLRHDPSEVAASFEVPLAHVLDERNHRPRRVVLGGMEMPFKDIAWDGYTIWGATGGMLITLASTLNGRTG
jgi:8-oxo-dGTP pyrophosphatase MutT (NUDIX family)